MPWRVLEVSPLDGFRFSVRFVDGTTGSVDVSQLIRSPRAGLALDSMYEEIKKIGKWILK